MFKGLFINAAILVSFLSISGQCFRENELSYKAHIKFKILAGVFAGFVGSILMFFSVQVSETFILDFRQLAVIVVSFYGGLAASIISSIIIGLFRLAYFGLNPTSFVAAGTIIIVAVGCGLISKTHLEGKKKWILMNIYCLLISLEVCYLLLKEIDVLVNTFTSYALGVCILSFIVYYYSHYISASNRLFRHLKEESNMDFLTGLNNVRSFDRLFNNAVMAAEQNQESISLLMIDIDFFKKINDTFGHPSGDSVLKDIAQLILEGLRSEDIVSRNGGEEFSAILTNCQAEKAFFTARAINKAIEAHTFKLSDGKEIHVTVSIGVSTYPDFCNKSDKLIEQADAALYKAKISGRNMVCTIES